MDTGEEAIILQALLNGIASSGDGGWQLTFSVAQKETDNLFKASTLIGHPVRVVVVPSQLIDQES